MKKENEQISPLTFDVSEPMFDKMKALANQAGISSISLIIRAAIERFDFDAYESDTINHKQISVRLPAEVRNHLKQVAKNKKVSVGELIRAALAVLDTRQGKAVLKVAKDNESMTAFKAKKSALKKVSTKKSTTDKTVMNGKAVKNAAKKKSLSKASQAKKAEKKGGKKSGKKKNKSKKK